MLQRIQKAVQHDCESGPNKMGSPKVFADRDPKVPFMARLYMGSLRLRDVVFLTAQTGTV